MPLEEPVRDRASMKDMVEAIATIRRYSAGLTAAQLAASPQAQDAILLRFIVLGEAANRVSEACRERHPDVPWQQAIGMRNFIAHGYDKVDWAVVAATITTDLPPLDSALRSILGE